MPFTNELEIWSKKQNFGRTLLYKRDIVQKNRKEKMSDTEKEQKVEKGGQLIEDRQDTMWQNKRG